MVVGDLGEQENWWRAFQKTDTYANLALNIPIYGIKNFVLTKAVRHWFDIHQYFYQIMHYKDASWIIHNKTSQEFTTTNIVNLPWWQRQQESRAGLYPRLKSRSIGSLLFYLSPTPYVTGAPLLLGWSKIYWSTCSSSKTPLTLIICLWGDKPSRILVFSLAFL